MIDTQVLSFALVTEPAPNDKTKRLQRDCNALVSGFEEIRVSAITVLELLRGPPQVVAKVRASGILSLLRTEAFDGSIAEDAARILEAARSDTKSCARCLNVTGASPCPGCGQLVSHQQKTHDAIIVATAARLHDVEVLYTCDQGVVELGRFVKNLRVEQPPNLDGPLFTQPK